MVDYKSYIPDLGISGAGVVGVVKWFVIFIVVSIITAAVTWYILNRRTYNRKIIIFEKIAGRFEPGKVDYAKVVKLGRTGDTVFYLRKHKKYLPTPSIQTGRNNYWFAVREDGEWINIGIEDIDEKSKLLKAHFLDKEMRYARVGLQRNLAERYDKPSFLTKYGGLLAYTGLIAITGIMVYLLFDKFIEIAGQVEEILRVAPDIMDRLEKLLSAYANVKSGSGMVPA